MPEGGKQKVVLLHINCKRVIWTQNSLSYAIGICSSSSFPYRLQSGYLNHHYMHVNAYTYRGYSFEIWHTLMSKSTETRNRNGNNFPPPENSFLLVKDCLICIMITRKMMKLVLWIKIQFDKKVNHRLQLFSIHSVGFVSCNKLYPTIWFMYVIKSLSLELCKKIYKF